jgi:hypothetical protein
LPPANEHFFVQANTYPGHPYHGVSSGMEIIGDEDYPTKLADARLVAAAPDLLAALKAVQFGFNHRRCAACGGWDMSPNGETDMVHTPKCIVALALTKAEPQP